MSIFEILRTFGRCAMSRQICGSAGGNRKINDIFQLPSVWITVRDAPRFQHQRCSGLDAG